MFALRDVNSTSSVEALASGLEDDSSLFKHEVCFVLGQMMHPAAVEPLAKVLRNEGIPSLLFFHS